MNTGKSEVGSLTYSPQAEGVVHQASILCILLGCQALWVISYKHEYNVLEHYRRQRTSRQFRSPAKPV